MVGPVIKEIRRIRNLTQGELAKRLGVSRQAVCMWETNKRELRATMLNKIAQVFDITLDEIVKSHRIEIPGERKARVEAKKGKKKLMPTQEKEVGHMKSHKVDFELRAPGVKQVILTGDFNSWDESGIKMKRNKDGLWKTDVSLKPGRYEYKFIVDGQWWTDPANTHTVNNSSGTLNSVKEITA